MIETCYHTLPPATAERAESQGVIACSTCGRLFICIEQYQDASTGLVPFMYYGWVTLGWLADLRARSVLSADNDLPLTAL